MADIVASTTLSENTNEVVMAFRYQYVDGGNESAVTKVDVSALAKNDNGDSCKGVKILEVVSVIQGMELQISKDADPDLIMLNVASDQSGTFDVRSIGGLPATNDITGASETQAVTVVDSGGNKYAFDGGSAAPVLALLRGNTYIFDQSDNSNSNHPLAFKVSAGGASYTTGVTVTGTAGQAGAKVTFVVADDAPSSLIYYCTVHGEGMGNTINITDPTGDIKFTTTNAGATGDDYQVVLRMKKVY